MSSAVTPALIYVALLDRTLDSGERSRRVAILMMIGVGCLLLLLIGVAGILVALSLTIGTPGTLAITGATAASVSRLAKSSRPSGRRP